jgi:hypothetical protein
VASGNCLTAKPSATRVVLQKAYVPWTSSASCCWISHSYQRGKMLDKEHWVQDGTMSWFHREKLDFSSINSHSASYGHFLSPNTSGGPLNYFMVQDIIWKADCHWACQKISCFLMELEGSLPCSHKSATGPYPEAAESSSTYRSLSPLGPS